MLAYVFWHRPADRAEPAVYQTRLAAFHDRLRAEPPDGFRESAAFRVHVPWIGDGYEDWYLVDDWHAVGVLNAAAVDVAHRADHDAVAGHTGAGAGGIFLLREGELAVGDSGAAEWSSTLPARPAGPHAVWQRQMVLGPAPEFCVMTPGTERPRVA